MDYKKKSPPFDEKAREAAEYLLERFWILREQEPELYRMVLERQNALRTYFLDKTGFHLIIHRHFVKLEKIPVEAESWMGVPDFSDPRDYVIFCGLMAHLEGKNVDEQFLLSDLCEVLQGIYPGEASLDWTNYGHRKSLVRVMHFAAGRNLVKVVEGDVTGFSTEEDHEVLYEVPLVSRYFMPSYPKELPEFDSLEEILVGDWREMSGLEQDEALKRRHRVYRRLLLSPALYARSPEDPDFIYLRNFRHRLAEDIEEHTGLMCELYAASALLTSPERRARLSLFPEQRALSDIAMQLSGLAREKRDEEEIPLQGDGSLLLTPVVFEKWVRELKERYGAGWSKQYREALVSSVATDLLNYLEEWKMAAQNPETGVISLLPLLARTVCRYPADFKGVKEVSGNNNDFGLEIKNELKENEVKQR